MLCGIAFEGLFWLVALGLGFLGGSLRNVEYLVWRCIGTAGLVFEIWFLDLMDFPLFL